MTANDSGTGRWRAWAGSAARRVRRASWVLLIVIPLIAGLWLAGWMREKQVRAVIMPDSILYIQSARWFAAGQGVSRGEPGLLQPMTVKPPLYSVALGAGTMLGATAEGAAIVINWWSMGLVLLFIGLIVWRLSGSAAAGIVAQAITAVAWDFVRLQFHVLSEPLFLALMTGGIWALLEYLIRRRPVWLVLASVMVGFSVLCRYTGISVVAGVAAWMVWRSPRRLKEAVVMCALGLGPLTLWVLPHLGDRRFGVGRVIDYYAPKTIVLTNGLCTLGNFVAPHAGRVNACWLGFATIVFFAVGLLFRRTKLIACMACSYLAFVLATLLFADYTLEFDTRLLMPVGVLLLVMVMVVLVQVVRSASGWRYQATVAGVAALCLVNHTHACATISAAWLPKYAHWGRGYQSVDCATSPVMTRLAQAPVDAVTVCGQPEALHFLTGRVGLSVPVKALSSDDPSVRRIDALLAGRQVVFVDMLALNTRPAWVGRLRMRRWFDLEPLAIEKDGALYWVKRRLGQYEDE